ncbi:MAG: hypothetical protein U5R30_06605 [Deltaproteobacteria bacterium]|nr:hypothetical protein [Deltaproteobacteria bacterium]
MMGCRKGRGGMTVTAPVKTSVIVGLLPKSTWAASPGAKSSMQVALEVLPRIFRTRHRMEE